MSGLSQLGKRSARTDLPPDADPLVDYVPPVFEPGRGHIRGREVGASSYRKSIEPCRCRGCRAGHTHRQRWELARRKLRTLAGSAEFEHGPYGYTNWGCRCEVCTTANGMRTREGFDRWKAKRDQG